MLTGDKIETAISIGKSCQLIPPEKDCLLLVILNKESFKNEIQKLALSDNEKVNKFFSFSFEYLIFLFSIFKKKFFSYFK